LDSTQLAGKGLSMSNAIIKQQGDSPIVADNIFQFRLGAGSFLLGALTGGLVIAAAGRMASKGDATPKPPTPRGWPINFAHRGGAKVVPEDTIEGFREGFAMGGGVVECDVHASAEGAIVVIHDAVVDRTTDGAGAVAEKTVPELQRLDAGYRFSPDGSSFPWRAKGVKIPTLEALYQAFPDAPFNIEIKGHRAGIEEAVFRQIQAAEATERTLVVSDSRGTISRFRKVSNGKVATASSTVELLLYWILHLLRLGGLYDPPFQALQPPEKYKGVVPVVTRRFIRKAHGRGLRVDVWTIDDEPAMRRLLSFGVDGIMTDRPDILARVLNQA
jgi:glycerophosphoryl diester phosphodiesterase